jgi:hypothetical protein
LEDGASSATGRLSSALFAVTHNQAGLSPARPDEDGLMALHLTFLRIGENVTAKLVFLESFIKCFGSKELNAPDSRGNTIAHIVVLTEDERALQWLLENAPTLNWDLYNNKGLSPLHISLLTGTVALA